ncbi:MAG TPA: HD domain-containing protein, partial [Megamonas hypermegale]|nr:HD domain-containing protein [Megamonas hypermegale]
MIQRIKQFVRAVKARLNDDDLNFINAYLNAKEQNLFFAMQIYDQRHVLNVAYTAKKLMQRNHSNVNERLLLKACLLHDVGRTANDIFLLDKVFAVLLDKYLPSVAHKLAKYNKDNTNHCF